MILKSVNGKTRKVISATIASVLLLSIITNIFTIGINGHIVHAAASTSSSHIIVGNDAPIAIILNKHNNNYLQNPRPMNILLLQKIRH